MDNATEFFVELDDFYIEFNKTQEKHPKLEDSKAKRPIEKGNCPTQR